MAGLVRLTPGEVFASRFEIRSSLAEGGMGTVYAATDRQSGQALALKVLLPELVAEERSRRRFQQEARVSAQIDTPHVPRIYGSGIDERSGVPWIAMELLEGRDLRQHVRERGALPLEEARPVLEQVGGALAAAHRRGLVHRDLKPENVFLDERGGGRSVKLLDFGVAKVIDLHRTSATGTGAIGSPMWMAPEQTSAGGRIAPATDVWSFALLTFFTLTGRFYWRAAQDDSGVAGLLRELHLDPIAPPSQRAREIAPHASLPPALDPWFLRATQRDSAERFRDAGEALESLRHALTPPRPVDRSEFAYAETLTLSRSEAPALPGDDAPNTQPMEQVDLEELGETAPVEPSGVRGWRTAAGGWEVTPTPAPASVARAGGAREGPPGTPEPPDASGAPAPAPGPPAGPPGPLGPATAETYGYPPAHPGRSGTPAHGSHAPPSTQPTELPTSGRHEVSTAERSAARDGLSPAALVALLLVCGLAVAVLTALIVWVALTVT